MALQNNRQIRNKKDTSQKSLKFLSPGTILKFSMRMKGEKKARSLQEKAQDPIQGVSNSW